MTVIYKDCIKELKKLKDESVDLIITDPPYNLGKNFGNKSDKQTKEKYEKFINEYLKESYRVLKEGKKLIFTYYQNGIFDIKRYTEKTKFNFIQMLVWHYGNIACGFTGLYTRNWEPIFIFSKGKPEQIRRIKGVSTADVLKYTKPQSNFKKDKRVHPTQKPYDLWKRLILEHTDEQDLVLDTFGGCCQAEDICKELKRKVKVFELNKKWRKLYLKFN